MVNWIKDRLKEKSTYIGISLLLAAFGVAVSPESLEIISMAVVTIVGALEVIKDEAKDA